MTNRKLPRKIGILAISPMLLLVALFLGTGLYFGDFYKVPLTILFIATAAYALLITRGHTLQERINHFSRGAGSKNLLFMMWIFVLAGAFASSAKAMGAIDASVELTLALLPQKALLAGIFIASCFISMSIGTSIGTIVALTPVAAGLAGETGFSTPLIVAATVGGALFGDNLSFISDTTVVATRTQGIRMSDKFRTNIRIVLPAAIITTVLYIMLGYNATPHYTATPITLAQGINVVPYLAVLTLALMGKDVLLVLFIGNLFTGAIGITTGAFDASGWFAAMASGISGMGELILISMLAGGLLELIRINGGITFLIHRLTRRVRSGRGAEVCIATLVSLTNLCTANNTIAILSVGEISRNIAERYGVDTRRSASILDTCSCIVQSFIPYGAQLLMAAGLASISPLEIIPSLFYPMLLILAVSSAIIFRYPRTTQSSAEI